MDNEDELSQLEQLLCADLADGEGSSVPGAQKLTEADLFSKESEECNDLEPGGSGVILSEKKSAVHSGDTDSSDDEEKRNYLERKYNDYGLDVKKIINNQEQEKRDKRIDFETRLRETNIEIQAKKSNSFKSSGNIQPEVKNQLCAPRLKPEIKGDVYTDPVFGIRITKPLISSSALLERMQGREAINMMRVKRHVEHSDTSKDWVIGGVVVRKSSCKQSQKGSQFIIWTLSDLRDDLKTVSMFLFRKAYNDLWKTSVGTVVAVLNPSVLDKSEERTDQACLSVDSPDRVMIIGQSKDLGTCKSKKKNGEPCTAFINLSQCEHCIYHVKQEYQKYSRRQELQSSTMGKGLVNLQNKVLGKNTVIYGGKAYSALPIAKNSKIKKQDQNRLMSLSDYHKSEGENLMINKAPQGAGPMKKSAVTVGVTGTQRVKDLDRLEKLTSSHSGSKTLDNFTNSPSLADKVANSKFGLKKPTIGFGLDSSRTIDLGVTYGHRASERAKANAIKFIKANGGLQKANPHNLKGTEAGKKRVYETLNKSTDDENDCKKAKLNEKPVMPNTLKSERFKKILEATSAHQNLIKEHEDEEQEKYFDKLEKKEAMEEKMLNTFKVACKGVRCLTCKYTSFSASQRCKEERHPLKVFDTFKRFFKCGNCGNRTASLEIIPLHSCSNCSSSRWEKASMMREKKVALSDSLSIRGEEESHIGGQITTGKNINLLVPE